MSTRKSKFLATASREKILPPKGGLNLFFGPQNYCRIGVTEGRKYQHKKIPDAQRDEKGEWNFLCEWRGFDSIGKTLRTSPFFCSWIHEGDH